jgi:K(+)-stimulated pyrophosphate-energized sodium pump
MHLATARTVAAGTGNSLGVHVGGSDYTIVIAIGVLALAALAFAGYLVREVLAADAGTQSMRDIGSAVQEGAAAYLRRQFTTLAAFAVVVFALLFIIPADDVGQRVGRSVFFLVGAAFSGVTGFVGMSLAVRANVRVAAAAQNAGAKRAMRIAFRAGGVAGMFTVGLGLLGACLVVLIFKDQAPHVLEGFGFGAALLAMFMRVGGGIFTKAADVGADLVGKVEQNIPEVDPRNSARISDNFGEHVGDCAGMAADLFESYAVTLVAALILGKQAFGDVGLVFPLIVPGIGILTAVIGILAVAPRDGDRTGMTAINRGFFISAVAAIGAVAAAAFASLPSSFAALHHVPREIQQINGDPRQFAFFAVLIGIVLASVIQ